NRAGRGRLRADGTLRPVKPPRGAILSTGEDVPRGHSVRARLLVLEITAGDVNVDRLTECQGQAAAGLYAQAMTAFLQHLAPKFADLQSQLPEEIAALRESFAAGATHARVPSNVASIIVGLRHFLNFAEEVGALGEIQTANLWEDGLAAFRE